MTPDTGCNQGRESLASLNATRRVVNLPPVHAHEFDTLRKRMQEPEQPYSKTRAVVAVLFTILAVLFIVVLNLPTKGHP